jgi:hypothetical protein
MQAHLALQSSSLQRGVFLWQAASCLLLLLLLQGMPLKLCVMACLHTSRELLAMQRVRAAAAST